VLEVVTSLGNGYVAHTTMSTESWVNQSSTVRDGKSDGVQAGAMDGVIERAFGLSTQPFKIYDSLVHHPMR
jgi:hypothetical protein